MRICVAVVEDELAAAQDLERFLEQFGTQEGIVFSVTRFTSADGFLKQYQPIFDLVFMDIRMPGTDGMTAAEKLRQVDRVVPLVFVTSMVQFAVKGYSVDALDFIVKPVQYPAFRLKMKRIVGAVKAQQNGGIMVNMVGSSRIIPANRLYYVEVSGHNLTYHTVEGDYSIRGKLSAVEQQLPAEMFFRCGASHIVNLRYVTQVFAEDAEVAGALIRIGRGRKREFMTALTAWLDKGV